MTIRPIACFVIVLTLAVGPVMVSCFETDQYNLPPVPLADIGDEFSAYISRNLAEAVATLNTEIIRCSYAEACGRRLAYLRSEQAVADAVYRRLGSGSLFVTKTGKWFKKQRFSKEPDRYKTDYLHSLYILAPANYLTLSPTVKIYGVEFGYDKIEHLLQQGHKYYSIKRKSLAKGMSDIDAEKKAVAWGMKSERTFFGYWVSGVYSNGDLYANFAGLRFYEGLTREVGVKNGTRGPAILLKDGVWQLDPKAMTGENLLKPFVDEGFNEAINPSVYAFHIFPMVRKVVKSQACSGWRKLLPNATKAQLESRSAVFATWHGIDYGFKKSSRMVSIGEACFGS